MLRCLVTKKFNSNRNISLVSITHSYFVVPKNIRLNSTHYFIMKIPNKRELQQILINHLYVLTLKTMNLYKKCTAKPYCSFFNDIAHASDNPLCFRHNLLEII